MHNCKKTENAGLIIFSWVCQDTYEKISLTIRLENLIIKSNIIISIICEK